MRWSAADHPQRALYAALRMQEELRRYSTKVVADGGMPIEAHVGINTGEVVVRSIATGAGQVAAVAGRRSRAPGSERRFRRQT